jgi:UDP-3-O-[3-hydroxymyristoyl] glucosamine N-acyltransferase
MRQQKNCISSFPSMTRTSPNEIEGSPADTYSVHASACVEDGATIGERTRIWHFAHVRSGAVLGAECIIGRGVFIDSDTAIGNRVKIQNNASIYSGVVLEDGVFVGPYACFSNDKYPRAINADGSLRSYADWQPPDRQAPTTTVRYGASIGAHATILPGIVIERYAMIAAGATVSRSVPPFALIVGCPGRICGIVDYHGRPLSSHYAPGSYATDSGETIDILPQWCPQKERQPEK